LFETALFAVSVLLLMSIFASKLSAKFGIPGLILFLGVGMLAGVDGIGGIDFNDAAMAQHLGTLALAFILFSGGLDTSIEAVKSVLWQGLTLSTLGVLVTALLVGLAASWLLDWPLVYGLLLGAVVSSTDAAAVFSVLGTQQLGLKGRLRPLLELESGSNDPMAVFLTLAMISVIQSPESGFGALVLFFIQQMGLGTLMGVGAGLAIPRIINGARLKQDGLYPVLSIATVIGTFGLTQIVGGNPFLAVYLAGIGLSRTTFVHRHLLVKFHDGIAWLMQILMFVILGLLATPSDLPAIALPALLLAIFLVLVARPVAVAITLTPFRVPWREQLFVGWVGLRGAVPIILATFPLMAGVQYSEVLFPIVFFMVVVSVLVQGSSIGAVAKLLKVDAPCERILPSPLVFEPQQDSEQELVGVRIHEHSKAVGRRIFELPLPKDTLIVTVSRGGKIMVPRGELALMPADQLQLLVHRPDLQAVQALFKSHA